MVQIVCVCVTVCCFWVVCVDDFDFLGNSYLVGWYPYFVSRNSSTEVVLPCQYYLRSSTSQYDSSY